jgi:hypothetical protein
MCFFVMSGGNRRAAGVDNTHRKTWDKEDYHKRAMAREATEKEESKLDARFVNCSMAVPFALYTGTKPLTSLVPSFACLQGQET